jgi:hypothetical protein
MPEMQKEEAGSTTHHLGEILALGYLRHLRACARAGEKGPARAHKGLDDVAPRGMVSPGPEGPLRGGTMNEG